MKKSGSFNSIPLALALLSILFGRKMGAKNEYVIPMRPLYIFAVKAAEELMTNQE